MAAFAPPCGRGSRGRHFTVFQSQPPGRQPFGLKVKSPRAFGPAPLPEGGLGAADPHPTQGVAEAQIPLRTAGGTGRHPPLEGCRPARGPGGLPGRSLSLSLGRESEARTSGATGVIPERGPAQRILWPLSFDHESGDLGVTLRAEQNTERNLTWPKSVSLRSRKPKVFQRRSAAEKGPQGLPRPARRAQ